MPRGYVLFTAAIVAFVVLFAGGVAHQISGQEGSPEAGADATPDTDAIAVTLFDTEAENAGIASFAEANGQVTISGSIEGLIPGEHGIHVHETGLCTVDVETAFASAGGHYNPMGVQHGGPPRQDGTSGAAATPGTAQGHAGDLGNITADETGVAEIEITTDRFSLAELGDTDGSALVVHADRDDLQTDPAGNSGLRVICGVIFAPMGTPVAGTPTG